MITFDYQVINLRKNARKEILARMTNEYLDIKISPTVMYSAEYITVVRLILVPKCRRW